MSWRRKAIYLILIAPLHHVLSIMAAYPAMLLLPPDIALQLLLICPLYALGVWWAVPAFQRAMGIQFPRDRIVFARVLALLSGLVALALSIVAVLVGIATPIEALALGAIALIASHALILRIH